MSVALSPLGAVAAKLGASSAARTPFPEWLVLGAEALGLDRGAVYQAWELVESVDGGSSREREALVTLVVAVRAHADRGGLGLPLASLGELFEALGADSALAATARGVLDVRAPGSEIVDIGESEGDAPLVARDGRLHVARDLRWGRWAAAELERRLAGPSELSDFTRLLDALDDVLARPVIANGAPLRLSSDQQHAVRTAATRPLVWLDGAPGSGKTLVLLSLLRARARLGGSTRGVTLAAPSEREARYLRATLRRLLDAVSEPAEEDSALAAELPEPTSVERLLAAGDVESRFVVVTGAPVLELDELGRLLASLRPQARLVLFGGGLPGRGLTAARLLSRVFAGSESAVELTESFEGGGRDGADRNLRLVARRVVELDAEALFHPESRVEESIAIRGRVEDLRFEGVELFEGGRERWLDRWYRERLRTPESRDLLRRRFDLPLDEAGAEAVTELLAHYARHAIVTLTERDARSVGEALRPRGDAHPVACRRSDPTRGLLEDEVGVLLGGRAFFSTPSGLRAHDPEALDARLSLAYASPLHRMPRRAEHLALLLPEIDPGRLDRARLLAALRAAGRSLVIVGSREDVIAAVGRDG